MTPNDGINVAATSDKPADLPIANVAIMARPKPNRRDNVPAMNAPPSALTPPRPITMPSVATSIFSVSRASSV